MTIIWFQDCLTKDEVKARYRELAHKYHPDKPGGDTATIQRINTDYAFAMSAAIRMEQPGFSAQEVADEMTILEILRRATEFACGLPDVDVIVRGLWVWVRGETRSVKDPLKEYGFKWSPKKREWYFAGVPSRNRSRNWTIEEIEERYGANKVKSQFSSGMARREDV